LFERINQRLVITETGKELLIKAKEVINDFNDFESMAYLGGSSPKVRIGSSLTLGQTVLPKYLSCLNRDFPEIKPYVLVDQTNRIVKEIESGNLDFAVVEGNAKSDYVNSVLLDSDRLVAVCSSTFKAPKSIMISDLSDYPLLLRDIGSASRDLLEHELSIHGENVKPIMESASNQVLISSAEAGLGITILPNYLVKDAISNGCLHEVRISDCKMTRDHFLICHKNKKFNEYQKKAYDSIPLYMKNIIQ